MSADAALAADLGLPMRANELVLLWQVGHLPGQAPTLRN